MYTKYSDVLNNKSTIGRKLKGHYHVCIDQEFKFDCKVWKNFLEMEGAEVVNHPMVDLSVSIQADEIFFFSDASTNKNLGFGCVYHDQWIFQRWEPGFIKSKKPSIEYLELFRLCAGILTWQDQLKNCRIIIFCDNQATVAMVNNGSSSCKNYMYLIHALTLSGLQFNCRVFAKFIHGKSNRLADSLSRLKIKEFKKLAPYMKDQPDQTTNKIWPVSKIWLD